MRKLTNALAVGIVVAAGLFMVQSAVAAEGNDIANPSLAMSQNGTTPDNWLTGQWGENTAHFSYPVAGFGDDTGAEVSISDYTSGDAKWYFAPIPVTEGETYQFSDAYTATVPSHLVVEFRNADNTYSYLYVGSLPASDAWRQASGTFTVPAHAARATMFHVIQEVGSLTTDAFSLEQTSGPSRVDVVESRPIHDESVQPEEQRDATTPETVDETNNASSSVSEAGSEPSPTLPTSQSAGRGLASLNFDDGWVSHYSSALPILKNAGLTGTFYIITHDLGTPGYMTRTQVLELQAAGMEIGAHTLTHPHLPQLSQAEMQSEISGSRTELFNMGIHSVNTFAYPFGEYNDAAIRAVQTAGFSNARSTDAGYNTNSSNRYNLRVQNIEVSTPVSQVKAWIDQAAHDNTWLILVFHQVDYAGGQYSYTPDNFQQVVNYLVQQGTPVVNMEQGVAQVQ